METSAALSLKSSPFVGIEKIGRRSRSGSLGIHHQTRSTDGCGVGRISLRDWSSDRVVVRNGHGRLKISCSYQKSGVPAVESENFNASVDEALILKKKAEELSLHLNGRCIYLVGMMGSGKTTVGKILAETLGYGFFDSDKLVEQAVGGTSVAQIFEEHSEAFFRDNESKVLRELSSMCQLVIATGGGAVIRPINWRCMKQGITVWLDVPLDALARRIAAVGTASRPLLRHEAGDAYTKAFLRLSALFDERGEAYANADARVCLQNIAAKQHHGDVSALTPTAIAVEALIRIENFLTENKPIERSSGVQG